MDGVANLLTQIVIAHFFVMRGRRFGASDRKDHTGCDEK
jgi:hypothetical protein